MSEKLLYLQATQSGDLFEASAQIYNGEAILKLVKNGCLYVRFVPLVTKQPVQVFVRPSFRNDPAPKVVALQPPSSSNAIAIFMLNYENKSANNNCFLGIIFFKITKSLKQTHNNYNSLNCKIKI